MAEITVGGLRIDTEDIDLLVLYCPLADLDGAVRFDKECLGIMPADDPDRPYWEHRLKTHELALDIAERTLEQGIKSISRAVRPPDYTLRLAIERAAKAPKSQKRKYTGIEL